MSDSERRRKHELECLRLASDLRQLARDVSDPALQARFVRMARAFQDQAEEGSGADTQTGSSTKRADPADTKPSRRRPTALLN